LKALVIGGTRPTGPFVVNGLLSRGFRVTILNRGTHEVPEIPEVVERIVGDPHFEETLKSALDGRSFDIIIASYGRLRIIADVVGKHTDRLISLGGAPSYRGNRFPEALFPAGLQVPLPEDAQKVVTEEEFRFGYLVKLSEDAVMQGHADGQYNCTHLRYPLIYGPRQPVPCDWWLIKRILDKREFVVLPDGGLTLITRGYAENMAEAVLLAVDDAEVSFGKIYNCGDDHQLTMAQWVEVISKEMGENIEIVSVPSNYAHPSRNMMIGHHHSNHLLYDTHEIRSDLKYRDKVPVIEAFSRTVQWYLDNPPKFNDATKTDLVKQYEMEDELIKIHSELMSKFEKLSFSDAEFIHPYAHPKNPGKGRDHFGR